MTLRPKGDNFAVWHRTGKDRQIRDTLKDGMKRALGVPDKVHLEYQQHSTSIEMIAEPPSAPTDVIDGASIEEKLLKQITS